MQGTGAKINNNKKDIKDRGRSVRLYEQNELADILDKLQLSAYEDLHFAETVELAVTEMYYYAEHITVNGEKISRERVRERITHFSSDCLDCIAHRLGDYGAELQNAGKYLISCL